MLIAIPSKERPTGVKSKRILPAASVFVPESEARDYTRAGVTNVVGVPDRVRGISATRNWILDNARDKWVVMVDMTSSARDGSSSKNIDRYIANWISRLGRRRSSDSSSSQSNSSSECGESRRDRSAALFVIHVDAVRKGAYRHGTRRAR
jgi:hypothetical protein